MVELAPAGTLPGGTAIAVGAGVMRAGATVRSAGARRLGAPSGTTAPLESVPGDRPGQLTLDSLGTPLRDVTFVVVDLETDGGAPGDAGITEFGAVKVHAGEVVAEFQSLVRHTNPLPPFISALTGISDSMLRSAPPLAQVLPAFLDFAAGAVLVAHNAPYDVGFLRGACEKLGFGWPGPAVIDTARLARAILTRDEVPNRKLGTLAAYFHAGTTPNHRALADARATVDVLHGLIERVGNLGVHSLEELGGITRRVPEVRRRKRGLADDLPDGPGVYVFEDGSGTALYVGTSRSIRTRVRSYFTAAEQRPRMTEMVGLAERVIAIPCATALEAQIRELRTIAARAPRYNRRSTRPQKAVWLKLTVERYPRISVVAKVRADSDKGAAYLGPYQSRRQAEAALEAINEALPLRACSKTLTAKPQPSACVLADLGRCAAPCTGGVSRDEYAALVDHARTALTRDPQPVVASLMGRMTALAGHQRYEDAALWRDRVAALIRGMDDANHSEVLGRIAHLVAAAPARAGGWEVHVIRHGRLAGAGTVPPQAPPAPLVASIVSAAEQVAAPPSPATAALPEESAILRRWLFTPGVRLVELLDPEGPGLALPVTSAARYRAEFTVDLRDLVPAGGGPDEAGTRRR